MTVKFDVKGSLLPVNFQKPSSRVTGCALAVKATFCFYLKKENVKPDYAWFTLAGDTQT
jgi:hypothetical protein